MAHVQTFPYIHMRFQIWLRGPELPTNIMIFIHEIDISVTLFESSFFMQSNKFLKIQLSGQQSLLIFVVLLQYFNLLYFLLLIQLREEIIQSLQLILQIYQITLG